MRLLRRSGAEDGGAPLRGHDGVVPHVRHLRHVLHAPRASQGNTDKHLRSLRRLLLAIIDPPEKMHLPHSSQRELNC